MEDQQNDNIDLENFRFSNLSDDDKEKKKNNEIKLSFITSKNKKINIKLDIDNDDFNEEINKYCQMYHYSEETKNEILSKIQEEIQKNIDDLNDENDENINNEQKSFTNSNESNEEGNLERRRTSSILQKENNDEKSQNENLTFNNIKNKEETNSHNIQKNNKEKKFVDNKNNKKKKIRKVELEWYYKEINIINERKKKREKEENEKIQKEIKEYFKPKINNYSKILNKSSDIGKKYKNMKIEDKLILQGKENKKKIWNKNIHFLKDLYTNEENEKRSFTPNVTHYPFKKKREKNVYKYLYNYNKEYIKKKEDLKKKYFQDNYPFKPNICNNNFEKKNIVYPKEQQEIFTEIIINITKPKKTKEKREKIKNIDIDENILENTKSFVSNRQLSFAKKNWKETANRIIENEREKKYKEIFDLLDEDKDNMISYNTINTANLNFKTLKIINPIINQIIEQKAQMITFREFYDICNNYL